MLIKKCVKKINCVILLLLFGICLSQFRAADFELIGNVESLSSVTRPYGNPTKTVASGFLDSKEFDSVYLKFDQAKYLKSNENFLDYRGKIGIFDRTTYQYNAARQIEKQETVLIQNGEEPRKISHKKTFYYLKNQLIRTDEFNSGRTTDQYWIANFVYENDRLKKKIFWMEDAIFSRAEYEFDENYNPVSEKAFSNNGSVGLFTSYKNDKTGMPVRINRETHNSTTEEIIEYKGFYPLKKTFKENGKIIEIEHYNSSGRIFEVEKINYQSNKFDLYHFDYQLDSNNNWIQCIISKNGQAIYQIDRKINYYLK